MLKVSQTKTLIVSHPMLPILSKQLRGWWWIYRNAIWSCLIGRFVWYIGISIRKHFQLFQLQTRQLLARWISSGCFGQNTGTMPVSMPIQFSHKYTYTVDIYIWICEHNTCQNAAFCSPMCGDTGLHAANKFSFLSGQLHPASVAQSGASSVSWTRNGGYRRLLYIRMIETHAIALCPCTNRPNCDHEVWTILGSFRSRFPNFFGQCKQKIDGSLLWNAVFMPKCIRLHCVLANIGMKVVRKQGFRSGWYVCLEWELGFLERWCVSWDNLPNKPKIFGQSLLDIRRDIPAVLGVWWWYCFLPKYTVNAHGKLEGGRDLSNKHHWLIHVKSKQ